MMGTLEVIETPRRDETSVKDQHPPNITSDAYAGCVHTRVGRSVAALEVRHYAVVLKCTAYEAYVRSR